LQSPTHPPHTPGVRAIGDRVAVGVAPGVVVVGGRDPVGVGVTDTGGREPVTVGVAGEPVAVAVAPVAVTVTVGNGVVQ
jgi:hypothetical protein